MMSYNYDSFSASHYDLKSTPGPDVGKKAPDFELETSEGKKRRILDFDGKCLVLELGSATCPLFVTRLDSMSEIVKDYPDASFAVLYVREAHPGTKIPAHKTKEQKKKIASNYKSELGDTRTILVDDIDGKAHFSYGTMPNSVYIIDKEGIIRFKASWNNSTTTRKALNAVLQGKPANFTSYFKPAKPSIVLSTTGRAGKGSRSDFFKSLPGLIFSVLIMNNIRTFFKRDSN